MSIRIINLEVVRGDEFAFGLKAGLIADHDWTGTTVRCQVRTPDGRLVWDFGAEGGIASAVDEDGKLVIGLSVPGAETKRWPHGRLEGDLELEKASVGFGPYTVLRFRLQVAKDFTR